MSETESTQAVSRSTFSFFSGTSLSRIGGLLRDIAMAFYFGSSPAVVSFMIAYRLANLFRRLLGEGPLASGFIPYFEGLKQTSPRQAIEFFRDLMGSIAICILGIFLLSETVLYGLYQYSGTSYSSKEIILLMMALLPGVFFLGFYGLGAAFLQCEKKFFLPAAARSCLHRPE